MKLNQLKYMAGLVLVYVLASCSKMDSSYDEFLKGEKIYAGKADSVKVYAGNGRVLLQWLLIADPKVSKYKVYWNSRRDSAVGNIQRTAGVDTIRVIINKNLREGPADFEIFTYDSEGNSSVKVEARGNVYGNIFQGEIYNRGIRPIPQWASTSTIEWFPAQVGEVFTEATYTDQNGVVQTVRVPANQIIGAVPNFKRASTLSYRTAYIPEPGAIDTFYVSTPGTANLPLGVDRVLDKSKFKEYFVSGTTKLPGDAGQLDNTNWKLVFLWNDKITPAGGNSYVSNSVATSNPEINRHVTFDLGVVTSLSRYRAWQLQDRIYRAENAMKWEIWGTASTPAADGSYTGWTRLTTSETFKPSGSAVGTTTAEDIAYATAGQEFIFPDNIPPVRYIRVKVIKNYQSQNFFTFAEMTFWEKVE